ncbi:cysteine peptidase family C39 domain-containing protein [Armatimonas sp.]|uniref:cysteine peptidase family C39 domain-containing protein n=1 Tax=Armatimonas sp. TaxID=1872638 RepID=UPI00286B1BA1|nr:cysteine peptidase family C39 domain-containing protein [Armatimonas sp.]
MRSLPEYQKATALFAKGDKAGAKLALEALLKTPNLSQTDTAFLKTQIGLCDTSPNNSASPGGFSAATWAPSGYGPRSSLAAKGGIARRVGDCGPRALLIAASELDIKADVVALAKAAKTTSEGTSLEGLVAAAKSIGLKVEGVQVDRDALAQLSTPLIAWWEGNHFVVVLEIKEDMFNGEVTARVHDPNKHKPESVKLADLLAKSGGIVLTLKK